VKIRLAAAIFCISLVSAQDISLIRQTIQWNLKSSLVHYQYGLYLLRNHDLPSAVNEFQSALDGDLEPPEIKGWAHAKLGSTFVLLGDKRSWPELEQAVQEKTAFNDAVLTKFTTPRPLERIDPEYTPQARLAGLEGVISVLCDIAEDGSVRNAIPSNSLGLGLDQQAAEAAKRWRFEPARLEGRPFAYATQVDLEFRLPAEQSRWHLTGVKYKVPQGVAPPEIAAANYPLGAGISERAIEDGRLLAAIGRPALVTIAFEIDEHGNPHHFEVQGASDLVWGAEGINVIAGWRFHPGTKDGTPIAVPCTLDLLWGPRELSTQALDQARRAQAKQARR
jgi:TonB family protein